LCSDGRVERGEGEEEEQRLKRMRGDEGREWEEQSEESGERRRASQEKLGVRSGVRELISANEIIGPHGTQQHVDLATLAHLTQLAYQLHTTGS